MHYVLSLVTLVTAAAAQGAGALSPDTGRPGRLQGRHEKLAKRFGRRDLDFAGEVESAWAEATAGVGSVAGEATVEVGAVAGDATSWLRRRGPAASAEAKKSERKLGSMAGAATPTTAPAREKRGMVTEYSTEWTTEYSTEWSFGRGADGGHSAGAGAGAGSGKSECDEGTTLYSTHFSTFTQVQGIQTQMAHKSHNSKAHGHKVHQSKAVKTQVATTAAAGATTTSAAVQTTTTSAAAQTTTTATSSSSTSSSDTTSDDLCSQSNVQPAAIASHNDLRAHYGASDLVWNATLVALAQTWADNCVWEDGGGDSVGAGSNIAAISGSGGNTTAQISMWSSEASEYSSSDPEYSHFTQMVWKATTSVGCAMKQCSSIQGLSYGGNFLVCEYYPAGNVYPASNFLKNVGSYTA